jgi:hypothetical protein
MLWSIIGTLQHTAKHPLTLALQKRGGGRAAWQGAAREFAHTGRRRERAHSKHTEGNTKRGAQRRQNREDAQLGQHREGNTNRVRKGSVARERER